MKNHVFPIRYEIERKEISFSVIRLHGTFKRVFKSGKEFASLPFERQEKLVKACVYHSAKNLDKRLKKASQDEIESGFEKSFVNTAKQSFIRFVNEHKDDIMQESFCNCLSDINSENSEKPLLLYITIECTKAINKYYYDNSKPKTALEDCEYRLPSFENPQTKAVNDCTRQEIFEYLPKAKRVNIITFLDFQEYGYKNFEIAKIMNVSEKTLAEWKFDYTCALACAKAENREFEKARQILDTLKAVKAEKAKAQAEKVIFDMVKGIYQKHNENSKAVNNWLTLSYIERINLFSMDRKAFEKIAKLAFKG